MLTILFVNLLTTFFVHFCGFVKSQRFNPCGFVEICCVQLMMIFGNNAVEHRSMYEQDLVKSEHYYSDQWFHEIASHYLEYSFTTELLLWPSTVCLAGCGWSVAEQESTVLRRTGSADWGHIQSAFLFRRKWHATLQCFHGFMQANHHLFCL